MFKTFISAFFKKNNANHRNRKGFTVIELIVVIAIIVTISAIVLADYRSGNDQLALQRSAHKLAQDLRRAQEMAMSSAEVGGSVPHGIGVIVATHGTQPNSPVPISTSTYYIYADMTGSGELDGGGGTPTAPDRIISEIDLESGVQIATVVVTDAGGVGQRGVVNFSPPDPEVNIIRKTGLASHFGTRIEITLALESDPSITKVIVVNQAGLIYVEQN